MIVDAHTHVWKADPSFENPSATIVSPLSDVPIELLSAYMDEHGVDRAVLVQPIYPGEDNSLVADCAAANPDRFAAVCVVDPNSPDAPDRLQYWVEERGCRGLRLRPGIASENAVFGDPTCDPIWQRTQDLRIVINILGRQADVPQVAAAAGRFPEVPVIIDHIAHPDVAGGVNNADFQQLLDLAKLPNISVKPTGHYYYSRQLYPYADCADFFRALYDRFGASRLVWGSDFPHVLLKTGYRRALTMQERHYDFLSSGELDQIMGGNAARLYWNEG